METSSEAAVLLGRNAEPRAAMLLPDAALSNCIFSAFVRDTRGCNLDFEQRFNHFAASPLCCIFWTFEGEAHLLDDAEQMSNPASGRTMPKVGFSGPQQLPLISWNPSDTHAMVLGFYPEAFGALTGVSVGQHLNRHVPIEEVLSGDILEAVLALANCDDSEVCFAKITDHLKPLWQSSRPTHLPFGHLVSDWCMSVASRAYLSSFGRGVRQVERRVKSWTGQSQRALNRYGRTDGAYRSALAAKERGPLNLAEISLDAGFADQSHMNRHVRDQTGFPPAELMRRIETEESFWCYRLLGERY